MHLIENRMDDNLLEPTIRKNVYIYKTIHSMSRMRTRISVFCACGRGHLHQHVEPSAKKQLVLGIRGSGSGLLYFLSFDCESSAPSCNGSACAWRIAVDGRGEISSKLYCHPYL
jgi:hypothetical protein